MQTRDRVDTITRDVMARLSGRDPEALRMDRKRLRAGAEAADVAMVTARHEDHRGRSRMLRVIAKQLNGRQIREATIYRRLVSTQAGEIAPVLLAVEDLDDDCALMFLESVRTINAWPWRNASATGDVLLHLGRFHSSTDAAEIMLPEWDYEGEITGMAAQTREVLDQCRMDPDLRPLARHARELARVVEALPRLRRQLFAHRPFGRRPIHGDLHPGNVLMRRRRGGDRPIFLDWGRARPGSPLEDVSSWLQSLRRCEGDAQRLHDTFFSQYLSACGMERRLTSDIRAAYWIAGASNALAGALLYHVSIAMDERQGKRARMAAFHAARDWMRVVRRAHAWTA